MDPIADTTTVATARLFSPAGKGRSAKDTGPVRFVNHSYFFLVFENSGL